jgi:hypothetical protein
MSASSSKGANTAERAPIAMPRPDSRMRRHWSKRSPAESPLCSKNTWSPKRARKRSTSWWVSEISGTSTITPRSRRNALALARR